jgi:hypothetical protein
MSTFFDFNNSCKVFVYYLLNASDCYKNSFIVMDWVEVPFSIVYFDAWLKRSFVIVTSKEGACSVESTLVRTEWVGICSKTIPKFEILRSTPSVYWRIKIPSVSFNVRFAWCSCSQLSFNRANPSANLPAATSRLPLTCNYKTATNSARARTWGISAIACCYKRSSCARRLAKAPCSASAA